MKSFEEWKEEQERIRNDYDAENAWYAGQQSKQAEVDELRKNFNNALKTIEIQQRFLDDADGANKILTSQASELQKRINGALVQISNHHQSCVARKKLKRMSASISEISEIEVHELNMRALKNILKGDQS